MRTERRRIERKRPAGISYFEFEAGSGGIVLDASEKGLGFQAAGAVHQLGPSRIWISPRPEERIELTGAVVWTDKSRKTGGFRFIETGGDSSKKIRKWLGLQESEASLLSQEFPLPAWATQALADLRHQTRQDANPRSPATPRVKAKAETQRPVQLHPIPGLPSLFTSSSPLQPQDSSGSGGRIANRVATGFLIVVLAVAGVVLFDMFRPKVGELLIHLGEKINGSAKLQPQSSLPLRISAPGPASTSLMNEGKPEAVQTVAKPNGVHKEAAGDSEKSPDSTRQANSRGADSAIPRASPTQNVASERSPYPFSPSSPLDRSAEAARLWLAVASGDSSAEVQLARLYLKGEGVPRNCEQAKVLLRAAAKGGSAKARQQLKKLRSWGCW
jgi:hypothetical protein